MPGNGGNVRSAGCLGWSGNLSAIAVWAGGCWSFDCGWSFVMALLPLCPIVLEHTDAFLGLGELAFDLVKYGIGNGELRGDLPSDGLPISLLGVFLFSPK